MGLVGTHVQILPRKLLLLMSITCDKLDGCENFVDGISATTYSVIN